jgi:CRISPR-associated exonuclease Cas4
MTADVVLRGRLNRLYFEPIRRLTRKAGEPGQGEGFAILTIQCSVIEFLGALRMGWSFKHGHKVQGADNCYGNSKLGESADPKDPVAVMAQHDPGEAVETLKKLGKFRREFPSAKALPHSVPLHAERDFMDSVASFRRWINGVVRSDDLLADVLELETIAAFYEGAFDSAPDFGRLWELAHPPRVGIMLRNSFELRRYQRVEAWSRVAGDAAGRELEEQARRHYEQCADAFRGLLGGVATELVAKFSGSIDDLLEDYVRYKRAAAVLDFDDLLRETQRLLAGNEDVRSAISHRYTRLLVDETQDTDPVQAEIIFRIASSSEQTDSWQTRQLIPGALFFVGDPKQSIFRFRSADVTTYMEARNAIEKQFPENPLRITTSFRSREEILSFVNQRFSGPLGRQAPGYVGLVSSLGPPEHGLPCVMKATVRTNDPSYADEIREKEAQLVANICSRLVGNLQVRRSNKEIGLARPGDIALLAPVGTDLWRYEHALEELGLPILSQAGRNLFRRQEAQDFVALTRALADRSDTLALGALLRGPLIGLTERELLEITHELGEPLSLYTPVEFIPHMATREAVGTLADLARRAGGTSPYLLLSEAIDRLHVRAKLAARGGDQASRALGNLDLLLERARRYGVRGLKQFALDVGADWQGNRLGPVPYDEARLDADGSAINLVTMHSAKGIEWPIVIPINLVSALKRREQFIYRRSDDSLHWVLGDVIPPAMVGAAAAEDQESAEERERLLYVACTRAMELLIIPEYSVRRASNTWAEVLSLTPAGTSEWNDTLLPRGSVPSKPVAANFQNKEIFDLQRDAVATSSPVIEWRRPSEHDPDRSALEVTTTVAGSETTVAADEVIGSSLRGSVLHKLLEEVLTGETLEDLRALEDRAGLLTRQLLALADPGAPDPKEMAATVLKTLDLPDVRRHRPNLIPEIGIYGSPEPGVLLAGRADAIAFEAHAPVAVFDWKSDIAPEPATKAKYRVQLLDYMRTLQVPRGGLVYMTLGQVEWVELA